MENLTEYFVPNYAFVFARKLNCSNLVIDSLQTGVVSLLHTLMRHYLAPAVGFLRCGINVESNNADASEMNSLYPRIHPRIWLEE